MIKGNKGDIMKKNKGFTLVELLAVIVILAIVSLVAVPSINGLLRKSRTNMFCKKVESIEAAAKYYAQDNLSDLGSDSKMVIANKIPIRLLVEKGYLKKDSDNCTVGSNCVTDPRDKSSLDNNYIDIYSENNRLYGRYLYNNDDANNNVPTKLRPNAADAALQVSCRRWASATTPVALTAYARNISLPATLFTK